MEKRCWYGFRVDFVNGLTVALTLRGPRCRFYRERSGIAHLSLHRNYKNNDHIQDDAIGPSSPSGTRAPPRDTESGDAAI